MSCKRKSYKAFFFYLIKHGHDVAEVEIHESLTTAQNGSE